MWKLATICSILLFSISVYFNIIAFDEVEKLEAEKLLLTNENVELSISETKGNIDQSLKDIETRKEKIKIKEKATEAKYSYAAQKQQEIVDMRTIEKYKLHKAANQQIKYYESLKLIAESGDTLLLVSVDSVNKHYDKIIDSYNDSIIDYSLKMLN